MPQPVPQCIHPPAVVARAQPLALIEIGDVAELELREAPLLRLGHLARERHLQLAEIAGEIDLLRVGQRLIAEDQDRMLVHAGLDRRDLVPELSRFVMSIPATSPTKVG